MKTEHDSTRLWSQVKQQCIFILGRTTFYFHDRRNITRHRRYKYRIQIQIPRDRKLTNVRARRLALKKKTPHKRTYRKANHIIDEKCPVTGTSFGQNSAIELELRDRVVESGSAQQAMLIAGPDPANPPIQAFGQFF